MPETAPGPLPAPALPRKGPPDVPYPPPARPNSPARASKLHCQRLAPEQNKPFILRIRHRDQIVMINAE